MPLFKCSQCGGVDNTAMTNYAVRMCEKKSALCSVCDPDIGKWHGRFPQRQATGLKLGSDGFLYSPEQETDGSLKWRMDNQGFKIVGDA